MGLLIYGALKRDPLSWLELLLSAGTSGAYLAALIKVLISGPGDIVFRMAGIAMLGFPVGLMAMGVGFLVALARQVPVNLPLRLILIAGNGVLAWIIWRMLMFAD